MPKEPDIYHKENLGAGLRLTVEKYRNVNVKSLDQLRSIFYKSCLLDIDKLPLYKGERIKARIAANEIREADPTATIEDVIRQIEQMKVLSFSPTNKVLRKWINNLFPNSHRRPGRRPI